MMVTIRNIVGGITGVVLIALVVAYATWLHGQSSSFRQYRVALLAATTASSLTTSFARVDVFRVLDDHGTWHALNTFGEDVDPRQVEFTKISAFCSRTFDITLGYRNLGEQISAGTAQGAVMPVPEILSINTVHADDKGKNAAEQCLARFEGELTPTLVKDALVTDGVWELHVRNGVNGLVSAARRTDAECVPTDSKTPDRKLCVYEILAQRRTELFARDEAPFQEMTRCAGEEKLRQPSVACVAARARNATPGALVAPPYARVQPHIAELRSAEAANALVAGNAPLSAFGLDGSGGYEGTIVLTMSANASIGSQRRVKLLGFIPLWRKEAFYFRREIAEVTFGAQIGDHAMQKARMPFFGPKLVLRVSEPVLVSLDRRVAAQGRSGDLTELERNGRSLSSEANEGILDALRDAVKSYESAARAMSRTIIRDRYESDDVAVEFNQQGNDAYLRIFPDET